jgi:hypothetical protein
MIDDGVENNKWLHMSIRSFFGFGFIKIIFLKKRFEEKTPQSLGSRNFKIQ